MKLAAFALYLLFFSLYSHAQQTIPPEFHGKWRTTKAADCSLFAIIEPDGYAPDSDWGMSKVKQIILLPDNSIEVTGVETYRDDDIYKIPNKINLKLQNDLLLISGKYHEKDISDTYTKCTKTDEDKLVEETKNFRENEETELPKDRWVLISNSERGVVSFDRESITNGSIWVRVIAKSKKYYFKNARTTLFNYEFLCGKHTGGVTSMVGYSDNGKKIFSNNTPIGITLSIEPESNTEQFYQMVCR